MPIDVDRVRADTPGCSKVNHLNNAGAALPPRSVTQTMIDHLRLEAETGGYEAAAKAAPRLERCYDSVAALLNCHRDEVAIVENATRAWDMAFYSLPLGPGDRILTARAEYASNYIAFLQAAGRTGATVEAIADDADGQLDVDALRQALDDRVKLIAVTHVPTSGGLINPVEAIGAVARQAGVPFLLDACQSAGQMPLDVERLGCDMLSATGRKFLRGPRGVGFLYVRNSWIGKLEPPFLDLHSASWIAPDRYEMRADARRFETWEGNVAAKLGLGAAIDYALDLGLDAIRARCRTLADQLRQGLAALDGVTVHDTGRDKAAIVGFTKQGEEPRRIADRLSVLGINVSISTAQSTLIDMAARGLDAVVRASPHYYNTEEEIDRLVAAVRN
ncbi:MAG: aminotransferase class V-fold PLP-dependent enzyme [Inquilinus sp.]|nr:aminotransferase class V-fold PLP-dependent enzyme [Inquilinus sp.]